MTNGPAYKLFFPVVSCNSCKLAHLDQSKYYWNCIDCEFDICKNCFVKALKAPYGPKKDLVRSEAEIKKIK